APADCGKRCHERSTGGRHYIRRRPQCLCCHETAFALASSHLFAFLSEIISTNLFQLKSLRNPFNARAKAKSDSAGEEAYYTSPYFESRRFVSMLKASGACK